MSKCGNGCKGQVLFFVFVFLSGDEVEEKEGEGVVESFGVF